MSQRFLPNGSTGDDAYLVDVDTDLAGWRYGGLQVVALEPGERVVFTTGDSEAAILSLGGGGSADVDTSHFAIEGRDTIFGEVSDFVYAPIDCEVGLTADGPATFGVCTARARRRIDPYHVDAADIPIEVRGGGFGTRQIVNFLSADQHEADRLIAVEVITPEGSWSSYPPHKHDEFGEDEVELEEIYYFRIAGDAGFGMFRAYTYDGAFDDTITVRDGDVYLVPRGYHGPAAAAPGHNMYYLNVMAGPAEERVWKFCDDPSHAWARGMLDSLDPDPRLPMEVHHS